MRPAASAAAGDRPSPAAGTAHCTAWIGAAAVGSAAAAVILAEKAVKVDAATAAGGVE